MKAGGQCVHSGTRWTHRSNGRGMGRVTSPSWSLQNGMAWFFIYPAQLRGWLPCLWLSVPWVLVRRHRFGGDYSLLVRDFILGGSKITADGDCSHEIKRRLLLGRKVMTNLDSILKSRDVIFADKGPYGQNYVFSSSHVWMWELDHKEGWVLKNWCFWTVVLEKTLESPLDCKEMEPVNPKGNQLWIFIGRTNAEVEAPKLWPPDAKNSLRKDPDAGKDWRQEKRTRGWDGWMASPTYRTWVWASSGRWWRTGKPDVLQSMGSQRIQHNWAAEPPPPPPANEHGIMSLYFMKLLESSKF